MIGILNFYLYTSVYFQFFFAINMYYIYKQTKKRNDV